MKKYFDASSEDLSQYRAGPLEEFIPACAELFEQRGYTLDHGRRKLHQLHCFGWWLQKRRIKVSAINAQTIMRYRTGRSRRTGEGATLSFLLEHLRFLGLVPPTERAADYSPIDEVIEEYCQYQLTERCLGKPTVDGYVAVIRRFLETRFPGHQIDFPAVTAADVTEFILHETTMRGRKACQLSTSSLRSFFRYLFLQERLSLDLAQSVPTVAGGRASELPRYLQPDEVERLLRSCQRKSDVGKRDYAILLLLARLGLRAGEVARLGLDDLCWRTGEIQIRGKGGCVDRLPLPQEVGQAIADYLQRRPLNGRTRRVFLHARAPYSGLLDYPPNGISCIVRRALKRAGLNPPHKGAHILRHSLATRMLGQGVSLFQIGRVLRHQGIQSTEVYAKVDLTALRKLVQPWPGELS